MKVYRFKCTAKVGKKGLMLLFSCQIVSKLKQASIQTSNYANLLLITFKNG